MNNAKINDMNFWNLTIKPKTRLFDIDLKELWRYRDLVLMFVKRDFVTIYKQTILGPLWYIIQPLFTTLVFTIIFGRVARISTDSLPPFLFYMSGNIIWGYFSSSLSSTSNTFNVNANIFGKVYFPRLTVPLAAVIVNFLQFFIQLSLFLCFYLYFCFKGLPVQPTAWLMLLPLLMVQMALLTFGLGTLFSSMTAKYKDLRFAMNFLVQLWMYGSPVVYPMSQIPERLLPWYVLNPMASIIESFRYMFFGVSSIQWSQIGLSWVITLLILAAGVVLFNRVGKTFMDTV